MVNGMHVTQDGRSGTNQPAFKQPPWKFGTRGKLYRTIVCQDEVRFTKVQMNGIPFGSSITMTMRFQNSQIAIMTIYGYLQVSK